MKDHDYIIHPYAASFELDQNRKGTIRAIVHWPYPDRYIFTVDIYSFMMRKHPEDHLGWWKFQLYKGQNDIEFVVNFNEIHVGSVIAKINGKPQTAVDAWINKNYRFSPLQDALLTVRKTNNEPIYEVPVTMKIKDVSIIKKFYHDLHGDQGYTDKKKRPFLPILHKSKLKILRKIFYKYIKPGWKVLDIGCGRSLFTEIKKEWFFDIFAGDLEHPLIQARKNDVPQIKWLLMNADGLPFKDKTFDALFAGEIIEHMPDPQNALIEWNRILRDEGIAIITTPNKNRFSNYVSKFERPFSPDHFREFSLEELKNEILPAAGFKMKQATGTYLELLLIRNKGNLKEDYLQRKGNSNSNKFAMLILNKLGSFFPSYCLDLIVVAEKYDRMKSFRVQ